MAYLVTYFQHSVDGVRSLPTNAFLKSKHPVEWASEPDEEDSELHITTVLLFWAEVADSFIEDVEGWCEIVE